MLTAEIIAIGSELLTPDKTDTNSLWLTRRLNDLGIEVKLKTIVGDDGLRLEEAVRDAIKRSDVVITTGGLGPTADDITREFTAKAVDRELVYHAEIETHLRERFRSWGREMPEINKRQAFVIDGAEILPNPNGSAAGMLLADKVLLAVLPGPPRENQPMFDTNVFPRLREIAGDVHVARRLIRIAGMGESAVDEIAAPIYSKVEGVDTSILFNRTEVEIHLAARDDNSDEAASAIADKLVADLSSAFGIAAFSTDGETMEEVVGRLLRERGESLSVAESCTGGLIGRRLTEVPGSSGYFMEGVITYSNDAKMRVLGVSAETLENHGAVSAECAEEMAAGMREAAGTSHAISVTGVAGPAGGSAEKPVGTVFIGYAGDGVVRSTRVVLPGDRYLIRWRASQSALDYLRRQLLTAG